MDRPCVELIPDGHYTIGQVNTALCSWNHFMLGYARLSALRTDTQLFVACPMSWLSRIRWLGELATTRYDEVVEQHVCPVPLVLPPL